MIKKLIGIVAALAVIAVIVVTALHRERYRSMVFSAEPSRAAGPMGTADSAVSVEVFEATAASGANPDAGVSFSANATDSLGGSVGRQPADSLSGAGRGSVPTAE